MAGSPAVPPLESLLVEGFYTALLVVGALALALLCGYAVYRLVKD